MGTFDLPTSRFYRCYKPPTCWRFATCKEAECRSFQKGFKAAFHKGSRSQQEALQWFRSGRSGLAYTESVDEEGITILTFKAGQQNWTHSQAHRRPKEGTRELLIVRQDGETRKHVRSEDWIDDVATNADKINKLLGLERV